MNSTSRIPLKQKLHWDKLFHRYYDGEMTPADWADWQQRQLRAVLSYVVTRSPFYRRHLAGLDPSTASLASLDEIPTTTKADLRAAMQDALSGPMSEAAIYYETTGTTGPSTPCPRGPLDIYTSNAHVAESWRRLFARRFSALPTVIGLMGPAELYAFCDTFGEIAQNLGVAHVKMWPESPRVGFRKALRLLRELQIDVVVCTPALCLNLARAALYNGLNPWRDFAIKQFFVLGEICTPEFRQNVRSLWKADVISTLYGSQEALAIGTGCVEGRLHLSQPNYIAEVLDPETGKSKGQHGIGELCLTMLPQGIKPLIRYRTGDRVALRTSDCPCGHPGDVIEVIGRVDDSISLGTRQLQPAELESIILNGTTGCLGYQIVVREENGQEALTVKLDLLTEISGPVKEVRQGVQERLLRACGLHAEVLTEGELDPITNTGAFVSWKVARIHDERNAEDPLVATARRNAPAHLVTS